MTGPSNAASNLSIDQTLRAFAQRLKSITTVEAVGLALAALGVQFGMPDLMIMDIEASLALSPLGVLFSARSLPTLRAYVDTHPLAENPVFRRSWESDAPLSLSEIGKELRLQESDLWEHLPPWARGNEAISINVEADARTRWNFAFAGDKQSIRADAACRSVLLVAARLACERLADTGRPTVTADHLTERERAVLEQMAAGKTDDEIAVVFAITPRTVRFHVGNAKRKLDVSTRAQVVLKVLRGDI